MVMAMTSPTPTRRSSAARTVSVVAGTVAGFVAIGLLIAGGVVLWANHEKDDAGYVSTTSERFATSGYALATDNLDVNLDAPGWVVNRDHYGKIRLKAASREGKPVFVGIAPTSAVSAYLSHTAHASVTDVSLSPFRASYSAHGGNRRPALPADQRFWVASAHGTGKQTLTWDVRHGSWSIVVMNADGSRGVDAGVSAGAELPFLPAVGWGSIGVGLFLLATAGGLMFVGLRAPRAGHDGRGALEAQPAAA